MHALEGNSLVSADVACKFPKMAHQRCSRDIIKTWECYELSVLQLCYIIVTVEITWLGLTGPSNQIVLCAWWQERANTFEI